jgi:hypothetical protein
LCNTFSTKNFHFLGAGFPRSLRAVSRCAVSRWRGHARSSVIAPIAQPQRHATSATRRHSKTRADVARRTAHAAASTPREPLHALRRSPAPR